MIGEQVFAIFGMITMSHKLWNIDSVLNRLHLTPRIPTDGYKKRDRIDLLLERVDWRASRRTFVFLVCLVIFKRARRRWRRRIGDQMIMPFSRWVKMGHQEIPRSWSFQPQYVTCFSLDEGKTGWVCGHQLYEIQFTGNPIVAILDASNMLLTCLVWQWKQKLPWLAGVTHLYG
jgi:hypothetical protein